MKTFRYRIYPNKEVSTILNQWFGQTRYVWNYYLNLRTVTYKDTAKGLSYVDNAKDLTTLKKQEDTLWLKECSIHALQQELKQLDSAFKDFFSRGKGYPRFKKRGLSVDTLHFPADFKIEGRYLKLPKIKTPIKMKLSRELQGNVRNITVSKNSANQYHVSILTDYEPTSKPTLKKEVGLDVGLKDFVISSDGTKIKMPHFTNNGASKLKKLQRRLSKKTKGSANREKARLKVAKHQLHVANQRKDFLHKVSTKLINENQVIALESLTVKGMIRNKKLSKHIANASWGEFGVLLNYKASWYGRTIKTLDKFFPSSKMCNACGYIKEDLKLSDRIITCKGCGAVYDRDINASKNILQFSVVG